ncbi:MAG: hypothetical protein Q7S22_07885 [Candidatus Micrarchaeota archaeon]|nr:hypothetical protein [Candidatus Micrarchaeota archaeon]
MKKIIFYVDSFGLGHITREIALARAMPKSIEIIFITRDHVDFIKKSLPGVRVEKNDIGLNLIPKGIGLDIEKTQLANVNFSEIFNANVRTEGLRIKKEKPDLIIADIPAEPFLAATENSIPIVAVSNFGWTIIIEHVFGKNSDEYKTYAEAYSNSNKTFVLPFSEPMSPFTNKKEVGLLRRRITKKLGKINGVINTFGKSGNLTSDLNGFRTIPAKAVESQNYVAVANAIFTKPSYGIVSEAISAGVPLFLKKRNNFPESDYIFKKLEGVKVVPEDVTPREWITEEMKNINWKTIEKMRIKYKNNSDSEIADEVISMFLH